MMENIRLSIIIAVFSETQSLIESVERLLANGKEYIYEIILAVSPYSSQECLQICAQLNQEYDIIQSHIQENNPGQGWAFREGINKAGGSHVAIMSADLETPPEAIELMVCKIEETRCDIVTANRWIKGGGFEGYGLMKMAANFVFQRFFMLLFRTKISDLTYGFRIFDIHLVRKIKWECTFHDFCFENILKPIKLGSHIEEIPTRWIKRKEGLSKNPLLRHFRYITAGIRIFFAKPESFLLDR